MGEERRRRRNGDDDGGRKNQRVASDFSSFVLFRSGTRYDEGLRAWHNHTRKQRLPRRDAGVAIYSLSGPPRTDRHLFIYLFQDSFSSHSSFASIGRNSRGKNRDWQRRFLLLLYIIEENPKDPSSSPSVLVCCCCFCST